MLGRLNIYKGLLSKRPKTPFIRQSQLVNQHEPPFIELRGAHFLSSEATALVEVASPLSEVQINCEQFISSSCRLAASASRNTKHANIYRLNEVAP